MTFRNSWVVAAVFIPAIAQTPRTPIEGKSEVVSVCTVLNNLQRFNGRVIAIRGIIDGSTEGEWMRASNCAVRLVTNGFRWPNAISIELPTMLFLRDDVDPNFRVDNDALERVNQQVERMGYNSTKDTLWLTYVGLFETKEKLDVGVDPSGRRWPDGFGHLNQAPGRLLIKTVMDPFIEHKKSKTRFNLLTSPVPERTTAVLHALE